MLAMVGVHHVECFVQGSYPGEAVPADQRVVEEREGKTGDECMDPHREAGQLDGDVVEVNPVDATSGDLASQKAGCLDLDAIGKVAESIERSAV